MHGPEVPCSGRAQRHSTRTGAAQDTAHQHRPGPEHRRGIRTLHVGEERRVYRTGRVIEGQEDDPTPTANRWSLGRHLDAGNQNLGVGSSPQQITRTHDAQRMQQRVVEVQDVITHIEAENL